MEQDALKAIAAQLKHPSGEHGIAMAQMMNENNIGMTRHAIQQLHLQNGDRILELGHGNCGHLHYLLDQQQNLRYQGLEISTLMHEEAQKSHEDLVASQQASFALYEGKVIPFPDSQFDKIFTVNTLYFWPEPQEMLSELHRVLNPNGRLNITFAHRDFMEKLPFTKFEFKLYDLGEVEELISKTAFKIIETNTATETVTSKTGDTMDREFTTISLGK